MTDSQYTLPLSPYLDNSTLWWVYENLEEKYSSYSTMKLDQQQYTYNLYQQWMRDQGVIVRNRDKFIADRDHGLQFVDEQSMMIFALRWGN